MERSTLLSSDRPCTVPLGDCDGGVIPSRSVFLISGPSSLTPRVLDVSSNLLALNAVQGLDMVVDALDSARKVDFAVRRPVLKDRQRVENVMASLLDVPEVGFNPVLKGGREL